MYTYETDPQLKLMTLAAVRIEQTTRFPALATLSQWAVESKWGELVTGNCNFWGIKRYPEKGPAKFCATEEVCSRAGFAQFRQDERDSVTKCIPLGNGICRYYMSCWFASYPSVEAGVAGYVAFLHDNSRYHAALAQYDADKNVDNLLMGIAKAGYADGPGYAKLLLTIEHQQNLIHAVAQAKLESALLT